MTSFIRSGSTTSSAVHLNSKYSCCSGLLPNAASPSAAVLNSPVPHETQLMYSDTIQTYQRPRRSFRSASISEKERFTFISSASTSCALLLLLARISHILRCSRYACSVMLYAVSCSCSCPAARSSCSLYRKAARIGAMRSSATRHGLMIILKVRHSFINATVSAIRAPSVITIRIVSGDIISIMENSSVPLITGICISAINTSVVFCSTSCIAASAEPTSA